MSGSRSRPGWRRRSRAEARPFAGWTGDRRLPWRRWFPALTALLLLLLAPLLTHA